MNFKFEKLLVIKVILILMGMILIPVIYYNNNIYTLFTSQEESKLLNLQGSEMHDVIYDQDEYFKTLSKDPNLVLESINTSAENLFIHIEDMNVNSVVLQVFYDLGVGFNEGDAESYTIKKGDNLFKFDKKNIKALRFDPGSEEGINIKFGEIMLNNREFNVLSLQNMIELIILAVLFFFMIQKSKYWFIEYLVMLFVIYNYFQFYYLHKESSVHYFVLILTILVMFLIRTFGKVRDIDETDIIKK